MELVRPRLEHIERYIAARVRGFSFDLNPDPAAAARLTAQIQADPVAYLASVEELDPTGQTVTLVDGSTVPRLPQYTRWMWDDDFAGVITFRWQRGTTALPDYVLGHIGYAVVEWKRGRGYATQALHDMLAIPRTEGLDSVELTTNVDNLASQRVILNNGGVFVERFDRPPSQGGAPLHRYRIDLH